MQWFCVECCGRYLASPRYRIPSLLIPRYFLMPVYRASLCARTRSLAIAEGPRATLYQLKSSQLLYNRTKTHLKRHLVGELLWRSLKVIGFAAIWCATHHFLLVVWERGGKHAVYSNNDFILHRFRDITTFTMYMTTSVYLSSTEVLHLRKDRRNYDPRALYNPHACAHMSYIFWGMEVGKLSNSKSYLQGHSRSLLGHWCQLTERIRFYSLPLKHVSDLHHFQDTITYFPKFKEVTWPWIHPFGRNLSRVY